MINHFCAPPRIAAQQPLQRAQYSISSISISIRIIIIIINIIVSTSISSSSSSSIITVQLHILVSRVSALAARSRDLPFPSHSLPILRSALVISKGI